MPLGLRLGGRTRIQEGVVFPSAATPSKQLHEGVEIAVQAPLKIFSLKWLRIFLSQGDIFPSMKILGSGSSFLKVLLDHLAPNLHILNNNPVFAGIYRLNNHC
jgi:hypothetical protein